MELSNVEIWPMYGQRVQAAETELCNYLTT